MYFMGRILRRVRARDKVEMKGKSAPYLHIPLPGADLVCTPCKSEWEGMMVSKLDDMTRFHQTALSLRSARQELLASNIANADTPNYKARDVDFASALKAAIGGEGSASASLTRTAPAHLDGYTGSSVMGAPVMYRKPVQPSADGNTVDMDVERAQFAENALRYEASVKFLSEQMKAVMSAIQG
jgi:flagellar basal-body rod protein FlgB